ncbi:hypothetical protein A1O1_03856 [Capronia coronata CBS 617.96]|uniref:SP-RING-type domain-containing protein n=1 Tax=Capronia coronata CBS 617.96 TaxID=1182541 RepID=W9YCZ0_9EURO|nr:uncharacterized protein A1O1_03856 [Capronia coronata CBS 617.96]EXJ90752.1 hypothetical protein A1O1_03856 [Capronia coronata CBS 617.96]
MSSTTFEPQPLIAPLNDRALAALENLASGDSTLGTHDKKLRDHLLAAVDQLTELTGRLNDRAYERRVRHEREQARRRQQRQEQQQDRRDGSATKTESNVADDAEANAEADQAHQQFQQKADTLTKRMDLSIRAVIDDQTWLDDLPATIQQTVTAARNSSSQTQQTQTQQTLGPTPMQSARRSSGDNVDGDGDGEDDDNDNDNEEREQKPATQADAMQDVETPHILLAAALQEQSRTWTSRTLTERYAHHNDYKGFYRVLYDAKHPGESAPPMPDERLWFAAEEGRELISTQRAARPQRHHTSNSTSHAQRRHIGNGNSQNTDNDEEEDDDDDEIEIASESVRIKCPITFLPYVDPVTSLKCNHSYEKSAILSMLSTAHDHAPYTPDQLAELDRIDRRSDRARREREIRVPQVKCPECDVSLTAADLKPNPALKRRVQRLLAKAQRRKRDGDIATTSDVDMDDDQDDQDDEVNVEVDVEEDHDAEDLDAGSAGAATARKNLRPLKRERTASVIPQTQLSTSGMAQSATPSRTRRGAGNALSAAAASSRSRSDILDVEEDDLS